MADDYNGYGYAEVDKYLFGYACFALDADEVAQENEYAQPNRHARICCNVQRQDGEEGDECECDAESRYEVADGEHARVLFLGGCGFAVDVDAQRIRDVVCKGYHEQRAYDAGFRISRSQQPKNNTQTSNS